MVRKLQTNFPTPKISNIIEKIKVHDQTNAFLLDENILYHYQPGLQQIIQKIFVCPF